MIRDKRGISVMQDAIIFCVMLSISAAILLPAFIDGAMKEAYIEKELEERADEYLLTLLSVREEEFSYQTGEAILSSLGEQITSSIIYDSLDPLISTNYLLHQSFANLIADYLACQLSILGYTINPVATSYKNMLKEKIKNFFDERLGNNFMYNLTVEWRPIYLAPLKSTLCVGHYSPEEKFTSEVTITMPFSLHENVLMKSQLYEMFQENLSHIEENVTAYRENIYTKSIALQNIYNELLYMCREFLIGGKSDSVINLTITYCFDKTNFDATSADIFNNLLKEITGKDLFLESCQDAFNNSLEGFYDVLASYDASIAEEYYNDINNAKKVEDRIKALKNCTWKIIQEEIFDKNAYQPYMEEEAQKLLISSNIKKEAVDFVYDFCDLYHAKVSLHIWRG